MGAPPLGYTLERNAGSILWLEGHGEVAQSKSPGVQKLNREPGACWIWLPRSAVFVWEIEAAFGIRRGSLKECIRQTRYEPPSEGTDFIVVQPR